MCSWSAARVSFETHLTRIRRLTHPALEKSILKREINLTKLTKLEAFFFCCYKNQFDIMFHILTSFKMHLATFNSISVIVLRLSAGSVDLVTSVQRRKGGVVYTGMACTTTLPAGSYIVVSSHRLAPSPSL